MSGALVTSAFARARIEISEAVRAIGVPPRSVRVLNVGFKGNVGVSRDRIEISEAVRAIGVPPQSARVPNVRRSARYLHMSFRAVGVSRIRAANSREISLTGNNTASLKEISPRVFWVAYLMSGALVTSAFAREVIARSEAVRAMETTFI